MTHAREQIRDAIASELIGLTTTRKNVFTSRVHPITDNELPCLLVFTRAEASTLITMGQPRRIERDLTVMIVGCVKMNTAYDDKLDKIAVEVEQAIYNSASLKATLHDIFLSDTEIELTGEAEKPVAMISMSYVAKYHTLENTPETIS